MSIGTEDLEKILKSTDAIEKLLNGLPPIANPAALSEIRMHCTQMRGMDSYISEKAGRIEEKAGQYLSARKHAKHPGGAFALRDEITADLLNRIRQQIRTLKQNR